LDKSSSLLESEPIPSVAMLAQVIDLKFGAPVNGRLEETLLTPVSEVLWTAIEAIPRRARIFVVLPEQPTF
jgi:hypothetical protein